eukprot:3932094-Rhodomonas_salina.1
MGVLALRVYRGHWPAKGPGSRSHTAATRTAPSCSNSKSTLPETFSSRDVEGLHSVQSVHNCPKADNDSNHQLQSYCRPDR